MKNIQILKNSGDLVAFDFSKLKNALIRSGAQAHEIDSIVNEIYRKLYDGITTKKIYQIAYSVLRKRSHNVAGRYRLKKAVLDLGPSGYPFEKLVGRLFAHKGYEVEVGKIIQGKCVTHEVDVIAKNEHTQIYIECKFHKDRRKNDVKIPLYIKSRFEDIKNRLETFPENKNSNIKGMLITNTRFSSDALDFGGCAGLGLVGWDYPENGNLRDWIDQAGFHPITSLSSLNKKQKDYLLENDVILCREINDKQDLLRKIGINEKQIKKILSEAIEIMKYVARK